mgnify:CR=1 FL=1
MIKYDKVIFDKDSNLGNISEIKIDQSMDEKRKEILRQVNEYIEAEKNRRGEKY